MKYLLNLIKGEPALITFLLSTAAALAAAYWTKVTPGQEAAVTVIGTALAAVLTAALARPVQVPVIAGAVGTVLSASAAYGLHLTTNQIATTTAEISVALGLLLRQHLTPVAAGKLPTS